MDFDLEQIYRWIDTYPLARPKKNIHRDFSDASEFISSHLILMVMIMIIILVPVVEILKYHFPKLVELHNYSPANSFVHKLNNWDTLNKKVLSKIDLTISDDMKKQLAKAVPGAIEKLLYDTKKKIESKEKKPALEEVYQLEGLPKEPGAVVPIKLKNGSLISEQKIVPTSVFDKMQNDIVEKDEAITILKNKVNFLIFFILKTLS